MQARLTPLEQSASYCCYCEFSEVESSSCSRVFTAPAIPAEHARLVWSHISSISNRGVIHASAECHKLESGARVNEKYSPLTKEAVRS